MVHVLLGLMAIAGVLILLKKMEVIPSQGNDKVGNNSNEELPYKKKQYLLSKAENNFYKVLNVALENEEYIICPMVRLADLIYVGKSSSRQKHFNRIKSKHIDFVICSKDYLKPLLAIELDDKSHEKSSRVNRDIFVDNALEKAGVPILRFKASYSYSPMSIKEKVKNTIRLQKI